MTLLPIVLVLAGVAVLVVVGVLVFVLVVATRRSKGTPRHGAYGPAPYALPSPQQRPTYYGGEHAGFAASSGTPADGGWSPSADGGSSTSGGFGGGDSAGGAGDGRGGT